MKISKTQRPTAGLGLACAGVLFAVTFFAPEVAEDAAAARLIEFYDDHAAQNWIAAFGLVITGVMLLFFAASLRQALRAGDRSEADDRLGTVTFGGAVIYAVAVGLFGVLAVAMVEAAELGNPDVITSLKVFDNNIFLLMLMGLSAMMLATGLCARKSDVLPRWLAYASIALGLLAVAGPGGFVAYLGFPFWLIAVSATLDRGSPDAAAIDTGLDRRSTKAV